VRCAGEALLAGLLRCGHCGRKLHVAYSGTDGNSGRYHCQGGFINHGGDRCISFGGMRIDRDVAAEVIERPHHVGIAAMALEPLAQPVLVPVELFCPLGRLERNRTASRHITLHGVMAAAEMPPNPFHASATSLQPKHLPHVVRRLHHLPPWIIPRRASRDSRLIHMLSPQLSEEGAIPRDAKGEIFHGARQLRSVPCGVNCR